MLFVILIDSDVALRLLLHLVDGGAHLAQDSTYQILRDFDQALVGSNHWLNRR
jgi:hypothetical protein